MARISEAYSFLLHQYSDNALSKEKQESILKSIDKPTQSSDAFMRMFLGKFLVTSPNCLEVSLENHLEKFDTDIQQSISKMRYEKGHTVFCEEEQPYIDKLKKKYKL